MNEAQMQLYAMRGVISEFPAEQREKIDTLAAEFRRTLEANGVEGQIAMGLVALELAAKQP